MNLISLRIVDAYFKLPLGFLEMCGARGVEENAIHEIGAYVARRRALAREDIFDYIEVFYNKTCVTAI